MASNSDLIEVGASGKAYVGAVGTVAPVAFGALNSAFKDVGFISDDGLVVAVAEDRKEWTPWGSLQPVRSQIVKSTKTFKIICWETNSQVLSLYYRQTVSAATPSPSTNVINFVDNDRPAPDRRAFVFDIVDGSNMLRYYLGEGEVTERGGITYKTDELIGYEMTITAYPDANGHSVERWMQIAALS